jgi:hypothetical protein
MRDERKIGMLVSQSLTNDVGANDSAYRNVSHSQDHSSEAEFRAQNEETNAIGSLPSEITRNE